MHALLIVALKTTSKQTNLEKTNTTIKQEQQMLKQSILATLTNLLAVIFFTSEITAKVLDTSLFM